MVEKTGLSEVLSNNNVKTPEQYPAAHINTSQQQEAPQNEQVADTTLYGQATVVNANTVQIQGFMFKFMGLDAPDPNQICPKVSGATYACSYNFV